jgi:ribonucleoside-diphosphate reductase alpha chain
MNHEITRQRLPRRRQGLTNAVEVAGADVFMTVNRFEDGRPGEVFAKWGKEGSTSGGLMDAFSIMMSLALQYGAPAEVIVSKLKGMRFEPMGMTDDPDVPQVSSVMDWVAQRIALDFLPPARRSDLDVDAIGDELDRPAHQRPAAITA